MSLYRNGGHRNVTSTIASASSRKDLLDRTSPLPAYQQISNDIILRISQKEWNIDDKLPTEAELATEYGVSRVTLRQAMAQLERDGIICKFQGKGAFVKNNPRQLVQELAFPTLDSSTKSSVNSKVLTIEKVFASNSVICEQLQVTPDTPLLYVERLFYHDGRPSGINHVWFRESDVPGLTESTLLYNSISRTLKYTYHYDNTKIENYIEAVRLDAISASLLNTVYDATGLKIDSQYLLADGKAIEYSSTTWLGDFTRFHFNVTK